MPLAEIISGAALGLALQILHEAIRRAKDTSSTTKCILDRLDATIHRITPLIMKVDKFNEESDESLRKFIKDLKLLFEKAIVLVEDYAELKRRNLLGKYRFVNLFFITYEIFILKLYICGCLIYLPPLYIYIDTDLTKQNLSFFKM